MANAYIAESSVSDDVTGVPIPLLHNDVQSWSLHVLWTSTLEGVITIEASNDPLAKDDPDSADWVDVSDRFTTIPTITGTAGNGLIDGTLGGFAYARLVFTHGASSGDLTVWVHKMRRQNVR